ncbi:MAG: malic enzyme-like NAD(P)-binding protein [Desulfobacterales bacterium]|nr:malic enzyme-like NAD(P)-binding protein [Desulfobacterales bacterium]
MKKEVEKYDFKIIKRIRIRIHDIPGAFGKVALGLGKYGGMLGDITKVDLTSQHITRDLIMFFDNQKQFEETKAALEKIKKCKILSVEDEVLNIHKSGKIEVTPTVRMDNLSDLRMIYTPGVAQVCNYIFENPEKVRDLTSIGNSICIATNGSAILGLGDIGVHAGMPVMEGKSVILHKMAGVSCTPILIDSNNADRIVDTLEAISKTFSMIMIEDIKAPLCFEVERMLQKRLPIPVFHDDQHGTATVVLAALIIALQMLSKEKEKVSVVISGAGAAGIATCRMLLEYGFKEIVVCDSAGAIHEKRKEKMNIHKESLAKITNKKMEQGSLKEVIKNKDIFIGVSAANLVSKDMVRSMNKEPIILALANPMPEIMPHDALDAGAAFAKDGRTVNNCLVFPGLIRGTLDARASKITYPMKFAAAEAIAGLARKHEGVPNFMNLSIHKSVAKKVKHAALKQNDITP